MASQEGSGAAGRAVRSLTLHSEGAGGVGRDTCKGRESSKTIRPGAAPNLPPGRDGKWCLPVSLSTSGVPEAQSTGIAEPVPELGGC